MTLKIAVGKTNENPHVLLNSNISTNHFFSISRSKTNVAKARNWNVECSNVDPRTSKANVDNTTQTKKEKTDRRRKKRHFRH